MPTFPRCGRLTILACLLAVAIQPLLASTRIYTGGVIVAVDADGENFVVEGGMQRGYDVQNGRVVERKAHSYSEGTVLFLLDGRPVPAVQALVVGHLCKRVHIKGGSDGGLVEVVSPEAAMLEPAGAVLAVSLLQERSKADGKIESQPFAMLRLEFEDGKLPRAMAGKGDYHPPLYGAWSPLETADIQLRDGRLTGTVVLPGEAARRVSVDAALSGAVVRGSFTTTDDGEAVAGAVHGGYDYPAEEAATLVHVPLPRTWDGGDGDGRPLICASIHFADPERARIDLAAVDGSVALQAKVDDASGLRLAHGGLKGSFTITVTGGDFRTGTYTFAYDRSETEGATCGLGAALVKSRHQVHAGEQETFSGHVTGLVRDAWRLEAPKRD